MEYNDPVIPPQCSPSSFIFGEPVYDRKNVFKKSIINILSFILDTDLFFYSDLDSLLWLQKQYRKINSNLKKEIDKKTKLLSLSDKSLNLNNLISLYNIDDILKLVFEIPNKSWDSLNYKIIDKILK